MKRLRVIFMGTPDFSVPALRAIAGAHDVAAVYAQPPRPAGRGHQIQKSAVHMAADALGIPVHTPKNFRDDADKQTFAGHNADVAVVAAYGLILPKAVLDAPKYGCINIHASLLPRWRGASPIQHAIWKGDAESGVTIMQMEQGLDTGPMLLKGAVAITPDTTASTLHDALSQMGGELILQTLAGIENLTPEKQDDAQTTYAPMLTRDMGTINWADDAANIDRQIRALTPWPGTLTTAGGKRLKILAAQLAETTQNAAPGTLLDKTGLVACGHGALRLTRVQPDGGKPMDVNAAINGNYLSIGSVLA